jgi:hypothetical protein
MSKSEAVDKAEITDSVDAAAFYKQAVLRKQQSPQQFSLHDVLAVINELLDLWTAEQQQAAQLPVAGLLWPVIIIDEAYELQSWSDEQTLSTLLNWCVANTVQRNRCHVLLVTSESYFQDWLSASQWRFTTLAIRHILLSLQATLLIVSCSCFHNLNNEAYKCVVCVRAAVICRTRWCRFLGCSGHW